MTNLSNEKPTKDQWGNETKNPNEDETDNTSIPKYVFFFIGDGMGFSQVQLASYYNDAVNGHNSISNKGFGFQSFPATGIISTFDYQSYIPDSASAGSALASGVKTNSNSINLEPDLVTETETIAEKIKKQLKYKIGILSTCNLNHATPADFYAHQDSRTNFYDIGMDMVASDFDYFAGGAFLQPTGEFGNKTHLINEARIAGYRVIEKQSVLDTLQNTGQKTIIISEARDQSDAFPFVIDNVPNTWTLAQYVSHGIDFLSGGEGFFMMCEGGKIDWTLHANDGATMIYEMLEFAEAIDQAIAFYNQHPDETLILVTADHETGGLSLGATQTEYKLYLEVLQYQTVSYREYAGHHVANYIRNNVSFQDVLTELQPLFGLVKPERAGEAKNARMVLTQAEIETIYEGYQDSMSRIDSSQYTQKKDIFYGNNAPLAAAVLNVLSAKAGIKFGTYSHTAASVPVYAIGKGSETFNGFYDNTEIFYKLKEIMQVK